jgi:hypothetical protein
MTYQMAVVLVAVLVAVSAPVLAFIPTVSRLFGDSAETNTG